MILQCKIFKLFFLVAVVCNGINLIFKKHFQSSTTCTELNYSTWLVYNHLPFDFLWLCVELKNIILLSCITYSVSSPPKLTTALVSHGKLRGKARGVYKTRRTPLSSASCVCGKVNSRIGLAHPAFISEWKWFSEGRIKDENFSYSSFGSGEVAFGQGNTSRKVLKLK